MNPSRFALLRPALAALVVLAAGCGGKYHGDGGGGITPNPSATNLVFSDVTDYNGLSGVLSGTPTSRVGENDAEITLVVGDRSIRALVPVNHLGEGQTVAADYARENVLYREQASGSSVYRQWAAYEGGYTITKIDGNLATVQVDGMKFKPCGCSGNTGEGTFTVDGTIVDVPLVPG